MTFISILFRCGSIKSVFFMEVGRFTPTGQGQIWMDTYDHIIADNINHNVLQ
jgi:hypothetical protein